MTEQEIRVTVDEVLQRIHNGWEQLHAYLNTLTPDQMTRPTDAAGWSVKDHVMHLAVWEDGIEALLNQQSREGRMGVDSAAWQSDDYDAMNDVIFKHHQNKSLAEVQQVFSEVHERLVAKIQSLTDEAVNQDYTFYDASGPSRPIWQTIAGNTFGHYEEHIPWMETIVEKG